MGTEPTFSWSYCIYGDAVPHELGFEVTPRVRLAGDDHPEDSTLIVEFKDTTVTGVVVVRIGCREDGHVCLDVNWDPEERPPGAWQKREEGRWPARWVPIPRRPVWDHLEEDPFSD